MGKDTLRRQLRAQSREPLPEAQRGIERHLFTWLSARLPGTIAAYVAMPDEIELEPVMGRLPGWRWVLPRLEHDDAVTFRDREVPRERHSLGMAQPVAAGEPIPILEIDLFLVPGLAFDLGGGRLGRGGGHYDRILSERRTDSVAVGVAPPGSLVDLVPREPHDVAMDFLATVDGVVSCPATT